MGEGEVTANIEQSHQRTSEFDGGSFTARLSSSPEGFTVKTKGAIGRTENTSAYPLHVKGDADATEKNKDILGTAINDRDPKTGERKKGEMAFQGADKVRAARNRMRQTQSLAEDARMSGATPDVIAHLDESIQEPEEEFEAERTKYTKGMMGKIGLSEIAVDEQTNTITVIVKSVPFPTYKHFANPEDSADLQALSRAVGTAMVVRTADGKIIIQHRSKRNAAYGDIPGASVAGMLDASIGTPDRKKGTPDPIDTESVKANIVKESDEELGLDEEDLDKVRIVGIANDKVKIHDELLMLADSHLTYEAIKEKAKTANRNRKLGDADFEEKFVAIDGSSQAIETLLTQVHCPLPPTHAATLVAAGYSLVLQKEGLEAANAWKDRIEAGVKENYRQMDEIVTNYYNDHPQALAEVPERYQGKHAPPKNLRGYTPAYLPEEQGLPSFDEEMKRVGLILEVAS